VEIKLANPLSAPPAGKTPARSSARRKVNTPPDKRPEEKPPVTVKDDPFGFDKEPEQK